MRMFKSVYLRFLAAKRMAREGIRKVLMNLFGAVLFAMLLPGCTPATDKKNELDVSLNRAPADVMAIVAIDMSGSFVELMAEDGKAYDFLMRLESTLFRNSVSTTNRLLLVQLSGDNRALLYDGTPLEFRRDFASSDAFRVFLKKNSNGGGSRLHDGIADAIDYVLAEPGVKSGHTKVACFALSDFLDNAPFPEKSEQRLVAALKDLAKVKGIAGFYYLFNDPGLLAKWRKNLAASGIRQWVCEMQIVAHPALPTFEY